MFFGGGNPNDLVEMYPVKVSKSAWSFVDKDGKIIYEDEFKNEPTPVIDGHFVVEEGDKYTFYEAGKKPKALAEGLKDAGFYIDGVIPVVMPKERISLMNGSGKVIKTIEPVSGKEIIKISAGALDGMFTIENEDGEVGFANTKGEVVIPPKYADATLFNEGYACASKDNDGDYTYVIIDKKGKEAGKLKSGWKPMSNFIGGRLLVRDEDGRFGFSNTKGEVEKRLPEKVEYVANFNEKYMIYSNENSYGVWKIGEDQPQIKAKYDYLSFYNDKLLLANNDDRYFLIDYSGEKKVEFDDYKGVMALSGKGFELLAREGSHYILINEDGKPVGKEEFNDFGLNLNYSKWVHSDYFNVEGMVKQLVEGITKTGYDKYSIGDSATKFDLNAEDHKWTSKLLLDPIEGYRYTIQPSVFFSANITDYTYQSYGYYYYGGEYKYFINPNAKVSGILLEVTAQTDIWDDTKGKLVDALKEKGFKVDQKEEDGGVYLSQGSTKVYILGNNHQVAVAIGPMQDMAQEVEATEVAVAEAEPDLEYENWESE